jgi:ADP-ribose pyrophosphatase YjhB (NUDIX family)
MTHDPEGAAPRGQPHAVAGGLLWRLGGDGARLALSFRGGRWGLPRGLVRASEGRRAAALRVVREQTGHIARAERFAGATLSVVRGHPLSTWYWVMRAVQRDDEFLDGEHLAWTTYDEALLKLDHPEERELLAATRPPAGRRGWRAWLARVDGSGARAAELRARLQSAQAALEPRGRGAPWRAAAEAELARAAESLGAGDLARARGSLEVARQLEALGMSPSERKLHARLLRAEARGLPDGWRRAGLDAALDGDEVPDAEALAAALRARDEARSAARRARAELNRRRLFLGLVLALGVLAVTTWSGARWVDAGPEQRAPLLAGVLLFGLIGATTGALGRALRATTCEPGPAWLRPLLGAALALGAHALLTAEVVAFGTLSPQLLLAAAWLAGFAERWLPR